MAGNVKDFSLVFMLRAQLDKSMQQFSTVGQQLKELEERVQAYNKTLADIQAYRAQQGAVRETVQQYNEALTRLHEMSQAQSAAIDAYKQAKQAVDQHKEAINKLNMVKAENGRLTKEQRVELEQEKQKLRESNAALKEAENAQKAATQAYDKAQASKDRLAEKTAKERQELERLRDSLHSAKVDTDNLAQSEKEVAAEAEKTNAELERLAAFENGVNALSDRFNSLAAAANEANKVLEPMMGFFKDSVETAGSLEYAVSAVRAVSGATEEETERMTKAIREMGRTTVYTAEEAAGAMQSMALAGWDAEQMIAGLPAVVKLAAAAGEDLTEMTSIVSDGMNAFQLSGEKAAVMFADVLAKAATSSNTTVGLLGDSLSYVETTAGNLGYTIQDVSVALAAMANNALKGGVSGSALNTMLTRMSGANETAAAEMDRLGLTMYDITGQAKPLIQFLGELRTRFQEFGDNAQEAQIAAYKLAGQRGMRGLLALVNQSDEQFRKLTDDVYNFSGAAEQISDIRLENFNGKLKLMEDAWTDLKVTIGNEFLPVATDAAEVLTGIINGANSFAENHGAVVSGIAAAGGALWSVAQAVSVIAPAVAALRFALFGIGAAPLLSMLGTTLIGAGVIGAGVALFNSEAYRATKVGTEFKKTLDDEITSEKELIETNRKMLDSMSEGDEKYATRSNMIDHYTAQMDEYRKAADDAIAKRNEFIQHLKDTGHYGTWENWNGEIVVDVNSMTTTEAKSLRDFEAAADDAKAAADELEAEIARLQAEQEAQTRATMAERGVSQDLYEVFANAEDATKALAEAYVTLYQETEEAYEKQFTLFELVEKETASLKDMEAALDSQKEYWAEYGENLDKVGEAARDAGIDLSGMWSFLASGSTDAAAAVAALAASIKGGDTTELEELVGKYDAMIEARTKATEYATEGFDEIQKKWEEVQKQIEDNVEGSEAYVAAYTAMEETFKGYLDGVDVGSSRVEAALSAAASRWKRSILNTPSNNGYVSTATLRAYAGGTDSARRGVALVGEEGPELMYLRGGEEIVPADKTREMLNRLVADRERAESSRVIDFPRISEAVGGGSGGDIHIEINVAGDATPETVRRLEDYSADLERRIRKVIREENTDARRRAFA